MNDWKRYPDHAVPSGVYIEVCFHVNSGFLRGWIVWKSAVVLGDSSAKCMVTGATRKPPFYFREQQDVPLIF
jgi:hypothetical protein